MRMRLPMLIVAIAFTSSAAAQSFTVEGTGGTILTMQPIATFEEPWAMAFVPDGRLLVTTKPGKLFLTTQDGKTTEVEGVPEVTYGGQGGLGDVALHPNYAENGLVYLSLIETFDQGKSRGAAVVRGRFDVSGGTPQLTALERIWEQTPKVSGKGHFSHRIAFAPDGMLFITSGDRQQQTPAQDFQAALGKVIRLHDDGSVPDDNPWQDKGDLAKTFWSMGHRNLLGMAFDAEGRLWIHEMGPRHGDELNLIEPGSNYGWPVVSNGDNYSGIPIPDHDTRPEFAAPKTYWVPAISPSSLTIYHGGLFSDWDGDGLIGGLSSRALIRVDISGETATEAERYSWDTRVREVETGPDGALWLLEDGSEGRLIKVTPSS